MTLTDSMELQNRLISEAKKSLDRNDLYMAKSYFLTASCMFPNSFEIQFERYLLSKKEENVQECCRILTQLLNLPENQTLNEEIERIVNTVKSTSNSTENNFQKQLFTTLTNQQQYQLLLKVANKCDDQTNYCQLMLLIMKKFPDKINEHAMRLVEIIINENKDSKTNYSKDYFCKLLIFDVFPLILSEESNLDLTSEQVEKLLENLFKIYFQQSSIGRVTEEETLHIDCSTKMNQMQAKLREIFNLIRVKVSWEPFVIPDQCTMSTLKEQYEKLMSFYRKYSSAQFSATNAQIDIKLKQVFYTSFMLFLIYLDSYIKLTVSKLILVQQICPANYKNLNTKKRKLHEIKNAPVCNNNQLQTAFSGFNQLFAFLNQDQFLQQELFRIIQLIGLDKCKSYVIFITDTYFYRGDNASLLDYFKNKSEFSIKSCVQLVNSSLMANNYLLTLEYTVKLVNMISTHHFSKINNDADTQLTSSSTTQKIIAENEKFQLTYVNFNKSDILSYAIDVIIKCLDELVLNSSKPTDQGIGHVIVLSQYKWPTNILFFVKCLNIIKTTFQNSKFSYPSFMQYILNTDILEEFRILLDNCKVELCIVKSIESKVKSMTTRGVNKNAKEEIKNSLINQMRSSKIRLEDDLFINFITTELKDFNVSGKKSSRR